VPRLVVNPSSPHRREVTLARDAALSIGRDPTNDVVLPDAMVSRRHAIVESRGGLVYLRDCGSANGCVVNGERVSERGLRDGDVLAIGTVRIVFRADPEESPSGKVILHPSAVPPRCPACGADYRRGDLFCRECGAQVSQPSGPPRAVCGACGAAVASPARFCSACGKQLAEARAAESAGGATSQGANALALGREAPGPWREKVAGEDPLRQEWGADAAGWEPAEPGSRLAAALVDAVFVCSGQAALLAPVFWYWWSREIPKTAAEVPFLPVLASVVLVPLALLLGALYHVYFWSAKGATPGKELLDLVVTCEDGTRLGPSRAGLRVLGYALGVASLGIGFLMIAFGGKGLHDRIAHTRVVRAGR
jgi:uncharacterized RDD family membrane protein YckC